MRRKTISLPLSTVVPIIDDGAIATEKVGEGRMVPVVIIDCNEIIELRDLIYAHEENLPPGDVECTWATLVKDKTKVVLILKFLKPKNLVVSLHFDIEKQYSTVDGILISNGLYLQPSESGMKVSEGLQNKKILVEIPDTGFSPKWEDLFTKMLVKKIKKSGFSRSEAIRKTDEFKKKIRSFLSFQMNK